jgi:hypothetical protein
MHTRLFLVRYFEATPYKQSRAIITDTLLGDDTTITFEFATDVIRTVSNHLSYLDIPVISFSYMEAGPLKGWYALTSDNIARRIT